MNGESDGVEASPHEVHMWWRLELCRNVDAVEWCVEITCEVQGDAGRAPVWEEGERVSCKLLAMR